MLSFVLNANCIHYFNVCYYNWTNNNIEYNNNGLRYKWRDSNQLIGYGEIEANQFKCFKTYDETMFVSHYITFYVNNNWYGIRHPWYASPYVISEKATAKKGGKLLHKVNQEAQDSYEMNLHFFANGDVEISSSADPKDTKSYIKPRFFK